MELYWENIDPYHRKAKVIGGWLVKAYEDVYEESLAYAGKQSGWNFNVTMCFVPDANHSWGETPLQKLENNFI